MAAAATRIYKNAKTGSPGTTTANRNTIDNCSPGIDNDSDGDIEWEKNVILRTSSWNSQFDTIQILVCCHYCCWWKRAKACWLQTFTDLLQQKQQPIIFMTLRFFIERSLPSFFSFKEKWYFGCIKFWPQKPTGKWVFINFFYSFFECYLLAQKSKVVIYLSVFGVCL